MENSNNAPTREQKQQQVFEKASELYGVFFNNEKYVEALHKMFMSYVLEMEEEEQEKDQVVNAYQNLRHFLRDTDAVFNPKTQANV
jgi:hypothetical protein